jgi:beta-lactamase superfamily II metal-dependent hydrolase
MADIIEKQLFDIFQGEEPFDIFLLDVGKTKYGDAIFCRLNGKTIWIDAAHPGDLDLLSGQLATIFPGDPPYSIDLLVVTHCHLDHIGCLPELLAEGILDVRAALVADEKLGFPLKAGLGADLTPDSPALQGAVQLVLAGLREETPDLASDGELASFLADAATQYSRYLEALHSLESAGIEVVRYGRDSKAFDHLARRIAPWGLTVLGPTIDHLLLCSEELLRLQSKAAKDLMGTFTSDAAPSPVSLFRRYLAETSRPGGPAADALTALPFLADKAGSGACLNDHSIVLKLEARGQRALLSGDQQFAKAEVPGLDDLMHALVSTVEQAGPYSFWKTSHHTSYNGVDERILRAVGAQYLGHSGGLNDPDHPDPSVLTTLADFTPPLTWARTERNGLIHVSLSEQGVKLTINKGKLNDGRRNRRAPARDLEARALAAPRGPSTPAPAAPPAPGAAPAMTVSQAVSTRVLQGGPVEVLTRVSQTGVRIRLDIEVADLTSGRETVRPAPTGTRAQETQDVAGFRLARGREIEKLLFVTEPARLAGKIGGEPSVQALLTVLRQAGHEVIQLENPPTAEIGAKAVRPSLTDVKGVVILGGFDIVPSGRAQVISTDEIGQLSRLRYPFVDAPDGFWVWSDDTYGDQDGDGIPELPVSRIPDGGAVSFLRAALDAPRPVQLTSRAGLHNVRRAFAKKVFSAIPGTGEILSSEPTRADELPRGAVLPDAVYLMLHGSAETPHVFDGEFSDDGDQWWTDAAFRVANVEAAEGAVVFCGCCYGALSALPIARQSLVPASARAFSPRSSIALRFLEAGANAYVGPTAVHFSPPESDPDLAGGRLHRLFWERVAKGDGPARALHQARKLYVKDIPRLDQAVADLRAGQETPIILRAVERKIYQMFSCLGLGW